MAIWYIGCTNDGGPTQRFASLDECIDYCDDVYGGSGGEIEYDDATGLYRCEDFDDGTALRFGNDDAAAAYYNELAG